ncbi:MarR family transcriptional regulator [Actinoallomurus sp. NPDC052274]|uniref:MarR family winged helix-turn-helix transcriptional regulator n=1 Tax=Actinoallomurus sp. NPDC052274 TaxID=3155420 RepID=UPI0034375AF8
MTEHAPPQAGRRPEPAEIREVLAHVPLVAAYFQRARGDMPPEFYEAFREHGLTARHGAVLSHLFVEESLSVTELSRRMGVSLSTASELVGDLSRAGWVERREDPANRRRTLVSMPDRQRPVMEEFIARRSAPLLRVLESLSPRDRAGFVAGLTAWAHEVRDWQSAGP